LSLEVEEAHYGYVDLGCGICSSFVDHEKEIVYDDVPLSLYLTSAVDNLSLDYHAAFGLDYFSYRRNLQLDGGDWDFCLIYVLTAGHH
jgi:hypothetical protein